MAMYDFLNRACSIGAILIFILGFAGFISSKERKKSDSIQKKANLTSGGGMPAEETAPGEWKHTEEKEH